ncbi:MAG: hypothetical protein C5B50_18605 [Verrucomicrobia bacterium]|nr:MAG: hypothetical protein C5B50_18605 [Verrucomicrobiota bacterium]
MKGTSVSRSRPASIGLGWVALGAATAALVSPGFAQPELAERISANLRPESRKAIVALCTPTELGDNYGPELQVAWRLEVVLNRQRFKPLPQDRAVLKTLVTNSAATAYSRSRPRSNLALAFSAQAW